jgi:hypothetical protein
MDDSLSTTNVLLLVMAIVSVLEVLLLIGLAVAGYRAYARMMRLADQLEAQHVRPLVERISAVLEDVRSVSARVRDETERVDQAIHSTIGRVDDTVDRLRSNVRAKTSRIVGVFRGARVALETLLQTRNGPRGEEGERAS